MKTFTHGLRTAAKTDKVRQAEELSQAFREDRGRFDRLTSLIKVTALVNSTLNEDDLLNTLLEHATQVTRAEASSIILRGDDGHSLYFLAATGAKADEVKKFKLELGEGIAGWVVAHGESVLAPDAEKDPRYSPRVSRSIRFPSRSLACVPMRVRGRVIGAIEVLNRTDGGVFDEEDREILEALANEAALAIENARLYRLSITDDLTGLYSQRYFKDYLRMELQKAKRLKRPLTVVMLDIDNFKAYNDSHGHAAGDEALGGVARAMRTCLRDTDVVARYGGEEFAIILPEIRPLQGAQICERIRAQVEALKSRQDGRPGGLTISVGLSSYPESADESTELFVKADQALYAAKRAGKNCVRSA